MAAKIETKTQEGDGRSRRRVPRRNFEAKVGVLCKGKYAMTTSHQIGEGGMMLSNSFELAVGNNVVLSFVLNLGSFIVVRATVRSVIPPQNGHPQRYGLEFLNLGFTHKREIRNFVAAVNRDDGTSQLKQKLSDSRNGF